MFADAGGRYDPVNDQWTSINPSGAPSPRRNHSAVWTGSEMLVWGGQWDSTATNTGGRYDPNTDQWSSISTSGAPSARAWHSAVWTGDRMLIWGGGSDFFGTSNTGGRYNPATNSWQSISTSGAPAARTRHTAVWTGSEMIIWGGRPSSGGVESFTQGGRYNPSGNSWTLFNPGNEIVRGRENHTAVWTGDRMLMFGGRDSFNELKSGASYRLIDTDWYWQPTPVNNAPWERRSHTGVWTGDNLLIWGGCCYRGEGNSQVHAYHVSYDVDLAIRISNEPVMRQMDGRMEITALVRNDGPLPANDVLVHNFFIDQEVDSATWQCRAAFGAHCHQESGTGQGDGAIRVDLPPDGYAVISFQLQLALPVRDDLFAWVYLEPPERVRALNPDLHFSSKPVFTPLLRDRFEVIEPSTEALPLEILGLDYTFDGVIDNPVVDGALADPFYSFCGKTRIARVVTSRPAKLSLSEPVTGMVLAGDVLSYTSPTVDACQQQHSSEIDWYQGIVKTLQISATSESSAATAEIRSEAYRPLISHVYIEPAPTSKGVMRDPYIAQFDSNAFSEIIGLPVDRPADTPHRIFLRPVIPLEDIALMRPSRDYVFKHNNQPFWMSLDMYVGVIDASPTASDAGFVLPWPNYKIRMGGMEGPDTYTLLMTVDDS